MKHLKALTRYLLAASLVVGCFALKAQVVIEENVEVTISSGTQVSTTTSTDVLPSNWSNRGTIVNDGTIELLSGDWTNQSNYSGSGTIVLSGAAQTFDHGLDTINTLQFAGTADKFVNTGVLVITTLILDGVVVISDASASLLIGENANISGAGEDAYIEGPLFHVGTGNRTFPIGLGGVYTPVQLLGISGTDPITGFQVINGVPEATTDLSLGIVSSRRVFQRVESPVEPISSTFEGGQLVLPVINENELNNFSRSVIGAANSVEGPYTSLFAGERQGTLTAGTITLPVEILDSVATNQFFAIAQLDDSPPLAVLTTPEPDPTNSTPFRVDVLFTEPVVGLAVSDFNLFNATASNLQQLSGIAYTIDITPTIESGLVNVFLVEGAVTDAAGDENPQSDVLQRNFLGTRPSVRFISTESGEQTNQNPIVLEIEFSRAVTGFDITDLILTNADASNLTTEDSINFFVDIIPQSNGFLEVDIPENAAADLAGNLTTAPVEEFFTTFENTRPSVLIRSTITEITNQPNVPIEIIFSKEVNGFDVDIPVVTNGILTDFSQVDTVTFNATLTPESDGLTTVSVAEDALLDNAGNGNTASNNFEIIFDTTAPNIVSVTSDAQGSTNVMPIDVVFTFSEPMIPPTADAFILENVIVESITALDETNTIFNVTIDPTQNGLLSLTLPADSATDLAGNGLSSGDGFAIIFDGTGPMVTLTSQVGSITNQDPFEVLVQFDEPVTGFTGSDLSVTNGSPGKETPLSETEFLVPITPNNNGDVFVRLIANITQDTVGNPNFAAQDLVVTFDDLPPGVMLSTSIGAFTYDGSVAVNVEFTEAISNFQAGGLDINNASITEVNTEDSTSFTINLSITDRGVVSIEAPEATFQDNAGNSNTNTDSLGFNFFRVLQSDSLALVDLYLDNGGRNWTNNSGWLEDKVETWFGVIADGNRISELRLPDNNLRDFISESIGSLTAVKVLNLSDNILEGPIPSTIGGLDALEDLNLSDNNLEFTLPQELGNLVNLARLNLSGNNLDSRIDMFVGLENLVVLRLQDNRLFGDVPPEFAQFNNLNIVDLSNNMFSSIPDFTNTAITSLDVRNNQLDFGDIEPNFTISNVAYVPQDSLGVTIDTLHDVGVTFQLTPDVGGDNNVYQWFKDGDALNDQTAQTLTIADPDFIDEGIYNLRITNTLVNDLTLNTRPLILKLSSLLRDSIALVNIYNATGGDDSWVDTEGWLTDPNLDNWFGVDVENNRVTRLELPDNGLKGDMPIDLKDIGNLEVIDLGNSNPLFNPIIDNELRALPNLSSLEDLVSVNVVRNRLGFADLEPNFIGLAANGVNFEFDPQRRFGVTLNDTLILGSTARLAIEINGENNVYQWYFDGQEIEGANRRFFFLDSINFETQGTYHVEVTSPVLPQDFFIRNRNQNLFASENISGQVADSAGIPFNDGDITLLRITDEGPFDTIRTTFMNIDGLYEFRDIVLDDYLLIVDQNDPGDPNTYFKSTDLFIRADTLFHRQRDEDIDITVLRLAEFPEDSLAGAIGGLVEIDIDRDSIIDEESRIQARRRARRVGIALRRRVTVGRLAQAESVFDFELVAYTETDDNGEFRFRNVPDGTYFLNIEVPGVPIDTNSFVRFEVGGELDENEIEVAGLVTEDGIVVEKVSETGIPRPYIRNVNLYPNPSRGPVTLDYRVNRLVDDIILNIYDIKGVRHLSEMIDNRPGNRRHTFNIESMADGTYFMVLEDKSGKFKLQYKLRKQ